MNKKDLIRGVMPSESTGCIVHKSPLKNQKSIRITKLLLDSLYNKAKRLKKKITLVLNIPINNEEKYVVVCSIKKERLWVYLK